LGIKNPNAHDGFFEIVVIKQHDLSGLINFGLTAVTEKTFDALEGYYKIYHGTSAQIKFTEPKLLQLDGEVIGKNKMIDIIIIPGAVQYISSNDNIFVKDMST
jgi:diacylglycerol kinase family enzyme